MTILRISAYYHDCAVPLVAEECGLVIEQEELFARRKHDANFLSNAVTAVV